MDSPLHHSHPVNFIHDEIVCEHPPEFGDQALRRQSELMVYAMREACQRLVTIRVEGKLSPQWEH